MMRGRSRENETGDVNSRRLGERVVKRLHIEPNAVGAVELADGIVGDVHLGAHIINETHIHPDFLADIRGAGQNLVMSATGDPIASGGDYVTFAAIVAQHRFPDVTAPGASWIHPVDGVYELVYKHTWTSYEGAGSAHLEVDGALVDGGEIIPDDPAGGAVGFGVVTYWAAAGSVGKVKVVQVSGSAQTCDAVVNIAITDPDSDGTTVSAWDRLFSADAWDLVGAGAGWWTTRPALTVVHRDADGAELSSFTATEVAGVDSNVRGISHDGTDLWVVGDDNSVGKYDTAGTNLALLDLSAWESGLQGVAVDGADLWIIGGHTHQLRRYSTAGVLAQTVTLPAGPSYGGVALHNGHLYVVDITNARLLVFSTSGTQTDTLDASGAVTAPTGVWIAADGTLYISKAADGVYRWKGTL